MHVPRHILTACNEQVIHLYLLYLIIFLPRAVPSIAKTERVTVLVPMPAAPLLTVAHAVTVGVPSAAW